MGFYALHLLSSSSRRLAIDVRPHTGASNLAVLEILRAEVVALSNAAALLDPSTRAYHFHGLADVSGFVAMACAELLVHGDEACRALGVRMEPDAEVVEAVLRRLFPSAPRHTDPWRTLLWATGRCHLDGHPDTGSDWAYHAAPLEEQDG